MKDINYFEIALKNLEQGDLTTACKNLEQGKTLDCEKSRKALLLLIPFTAVDLHLTEIESKISSLKSSQNLTFIFGFSALNVALFTLFRIDFLSINTAFGISLLSMVLCWRYYCNEKIIKLFYATKKRKMELREKQLLEAISEIYTLK